MSSSTAPSVWRRESSRFKAAPGESLYAAAARAASYGMRMKDSGEAR